MATALLAGAIANKPFNGGEPWVRLSWLLGLRRLGFDVYLVERLSERACVDAQGRPAPFAESANRAHLERVADEFGLRARTALIDERGGSLWGVGTQELREAAVDAEVLFDMSGHLGELEPAGLARRRAYVDLDPAFTQVWHADPALEFDISGYDAYVTVGLNVGRPGCPIPTGGIDWIPTLPPVLLDEWDGPPPPAEPFRFTTVATWRSPYGQLELEGRTLGLKHHEFRRLLELPRQVPDAQFELALEIAQEDAADARALREHGWRLGSAREAAGTPSGFREYVLASSGELSVAQGAYAHTRSGWFSDRTAAYLAAGRPALVQDTGIGSWLARGEGLLTFSTPAAAAAGAREILADPLAHAQAARALAERHLDSYLVLGGLLERLGVGG